MPPAFEESDFGAFAEAKWRNAEYNAERLKVRRKIVALAEEARARLAAAGLPAEAQVSLHHPYIFNRFCVDSIWGYFSRPEADRRDLKNILGVEFGKDLDTNYTHAFLAVGIDRDGIETGLKIHAQAWWDGQNLKNKTARPEGFGEFHRLLLALPPGFFLTIHDWRREYGCAGILKGDLDRYLSLYTPGNHWFHLRRRHPKEEIMGANAAYWEGCFSELAAVVPLYRFIAWSPANNHVFQQPSPRR